MRTRVKICGITRPEDALGAALLGVDAIGLVFYPPSPRHVSIAQARTICMALPPFVSVVALFVDADMREVHAVLQEVPVDILQFHGEEEPAYCTSFGRPYIKALRMREGLDVASAARTHAKARGLLLDTYQPGLVGGTGHCFDWYRVPRDLEMPLILAGGLDAGNVAKAIQIAQPYAVDTSGGVEEARGIKNMEKITAFMRSVERA